MAESMDDIMHPGLRADRDPSFPHAPDDWSKNAAEAKAKEEGLDLTEEHWVSIRALQEYFARNEVPHARELHDALDEKFHAEGGIKRLYQLFPGGPIAQGCRIAGLQPPPGSEDKSFGSVQ